MEENETAAAPAPVDQKDTIAREIYAAWRNKHFNELPVDLFNRLEAAAEHLIAEIRAKL